MANEIFAVERVYQAVVDRFTAEGTVAANVFGWQRTAQQVEGNRIAWRPGDAAGKVGETAAPRNPGRNPRPLATLLELFTVTISAADSTAPDDEMAQYRAARMLRDAFYRAIYLAAPGGHGNFSIIDEKWIDARKERRYGAAIELTLMLRTSVLDTPLALAPANLGASIDFNLNETADDPPIVVTNP